MDQISSFKTLIVEDSLIFRGIVKEALETEFPGMKIYEAGNSAEALRIVEDFNPNLIFMDINLQGDNGLVITGKIKTRHPEMIVVILTNYDIPEYREAALRVKANQFIPKNTFSKEILKKLVKPLLINPQNSGSVSS